MEMLPCRMRRMFLHVPRGTAHCLHYMLCVWHRTARIRCKSAFIFGRIGAEGKLGHVDNDILHSVPHTVHLMPVRASTGGGGVRFMACRSLGDLRAMPFTKED